MSTAFFVGVSLLMLPASGALETPCESERAQLRFLVQKYGQERTQLEFALARVEAERQRLEAELAKRGGEGK